MISHRLTIRIAAWAVFLGLLLARPAAAYVTFGAGFSSKWGDEPAFGNGAVVTWGFMLDGTTVDPAVPDHLDLSGTSQIGTLRAALDTQYGSGAFDTAIQNAFNTWSAVANINFEGPIVDSGLPAGQQGVTSPDIRIGAFHAVPESNFSYVGAIGYGPPGIITPENDFPESGDIFFNLDAGFQIASGEEDVTPLDWNLGNDLENLFLHELGHAAIGLGHPRWEGEDPDQRVMYVGDYFSHPEWPECCETVNHSLHVDDIAGAQYIYGIRGDYNRDGRVDAADYTAWRDASTAAVTSGTGADGNVDGTVDATDYAVWTDNFGNQVLTGFGDEWNSAAAAAPEPGTTLLAAIACTVLGTASRNFRVRRTH